MAPPVAPIVFVSDNAASGSSSYTATVSATTGAGDTLVLAVSATASGSYPVSVSDSQSNTWVPVTTQTESAQLAVFWCVSADQLVSGTDTVTVKLAGSSSNINFCGLDLGGGWAYDNIPGAVGTSGTTQSVSTGTMTYGNELVLGFGWYATYSPTWQSPLTSLALESGNSAGYLAVACDQYGGPSAVTVETTTTSAPPDWAMIALTMYSVVPAQTRAPSVPDWIAGFGPQQSDMQSLWVNPLAFFQNRVVFRAVEQLTATTLPASSAITKIGYDYILEDPYNGWNSSNSEWTPPSNGSGWYEITVTVYVVAPAAENIMLSPYIGGNAAYNWVNDIALSRICIPENIAGAEGSFILYLTGGQDAVWGAGSIINSGSSLATNLTAGQSSSIEIVFLGT